MKVLSHVDFPTEGTSSPRPVRVCMHILREARTDVRVMREATALAEVGFAVSIIDVGYDPALPPQEEIQGISFRHIIMPSWNVPTRFKPWFLAKLALMIIIGIMKVACTEASIYHAYDETALPACYAAACLRRKRLIFDAMELPLSEPTVTRWHKLASLSSYLLTSMLPRCAGVIAVSPPIVEEMRKRYRGANVTLIRNIPPYCAVQRSNKLREYLGVKSDVCIALYQGNIQLDRGLHKLVYAASFLNPNIIIVIMGKGPVAVTSEIQSLIERECVADRVKMIPPVPYEDLLNWTASADLGLIIYTPQYSLNVQMMLPNKLFEYLMAGLPILASQLDAVAQVIKTYDVGQVVSSLTPEDIAAAINAMLSDRVVLARQHQNALEVAQHEFYWEKERTGLINLYHNSLGKLNTEHEAQKMVVHDKPPFAES